MNAVLMSIQPKWCELIASGKKTVEVRKTKPKLATPFKVYIYETQGRAETPFVDEDGHVIFKGRGQVIGEFVCDSIMRIERSVGCFFLPGKTRSESNAIAIASCMDFLDMGAYFGLSDTGYAWHISDLVIYEKPKELSEYSRHDNSYDNAFGWAFEDRAKNTPIKRPPQSWCYVEKGE